MSRSTNVIGRVILSSLFILGGINKLLDYEPTAEYMANAGLPWIDITLPLVICLELGGGLLVAAGHSLFGSLSAAALAIFTLAVNLLFHDFWNVNDPELRRLELSLFFKNIAIIGGLIVVSSTLAQSWQKRYPG